MGIDENLRQQKVAERRKESGFQTKKYHLFKRDIGRLNTLGKIMGYDTSKPLSNEEYSSIIRTCIAERYTKVFPKKNVKVPDTQIRQREYELKQIISYRASKGDSNSDIATFLEKNGYRLPSDNDDMSYSGQQNSEEIWTAKRVEQLKMKKK